MAKNVKLMQIMSHTSLSIINAVTSNTYLMPCIVVFDAKSEIICFPAFLLLELIIKDTDTEKSLQNIRNGEGSVSNLFVFDLSGHRGHRMA